MQLLVITATRKEQGPLTEDRAMVLGELGSSAVGGTGEESAEDRWTAAVGKDDMVAASPRVALRRASLRGDNNTSYLIGKVWLILSAWEFPSQRRVRVWIPMADPGA